MKWWLVVLGLGFWSRWRLCVSCLTDSNPTPSIFPSSSHAVHEAFHTYWPEEEKKGTLAAVKEAASDMAANLKTKVA